MMTIIHSGGFKLCYKVNNYFLLCKIISQNTHYVNEALITCETQVWLNQHDE